MKAVVFLADGFEECEALIVVDILRRAGVETVMASAMDSLTVDSSRHVRVLADVFADSVDYDTTDLIFLPGGRLGTENLGANQTVTDKCREFAAGKLLAAICAAPSLLASLGLLEGKRATCHPDFEGQMAGAVLTGDSVTLDGNIITGQGLGASFDFAFELVKILVGDEKAEGIRKAICYRY